MAKLFDRHPVRFTGNFFDMMDWCDIVMFSGVALVITSPPVTLLVNPKAFAFLKRVQEMLSPEGWLLLDAPVLKMCPLTKLAIGGHIEGLCLSQIIEQGDMYENGTLQRLYCFTPMRRAQIPAKPFPLLDAEGPCFENEPPLAHRCEFRPLWIAALIEAFSEPDDVVLDTFCGTGTVPRVACELGRRGYGIDLRSPHVFTETSESD